MAVHGPAGSGKTSWLAHYAAGLAARQAALFLRGQAIDPTSRSLETLADSALASADEERWREAPTAADLARALRAHGQSLWVLLDALNESRMAPLNLADMWIPETLAWVRREGMRLVITCRSDDWQLLADRVPRDLVHRPAPQATRAGQQPGVAVDAFSPEEAEAALQAYGLAEYLEAKLLSHPLAMRLTWELAREDPAALPKGPRRPELSAVIDRLVDRQAERVALALGPPPRTAPVSAFGGLSR